MRTIYLHVGLHKTGTTSIQHAFFDARQKLLAHDIDYFEIASNHGHSLFPLFAGPRLAARQQQRFGIADDEIDRRNAATMNTLRRAFGRSRSSRFIVSAEALSMLPAAGVVRLKETLRPYADRFKVIAYVREPFGAMTSAFVQCMRNGRTMEELMAAPPWPRYSRLQNYIDAFGRENVDIRIFDRAEFVDGDLYADFLGAIDAPRSLTRLLRKRHLNVSLSQNAAAVLEQVNIRHRNTFGEPNHQRSQRIAHWLAWVPGLPFVCPPGTYDRAEAVLNPETQWLRDTLGRDVFASASPPATNSTWHRSALSALAAVADTIVPPKAA